MNLSQLFHFDTGNKEVQQWLNAGLYPLVATVNDRRVMVYMEDVDGKIWGSTEPPTEETPPTATITYKTTNQEKLQDFNDQLDGLKKYINPDTATATINVKFTEDGQ
jgi:hypothetical protein